jgi:hypothetical protein
MFETDPLHPKITANEPQQENAMFDFTDAKRRRFLQTVGIGAAGLAATGLGLIETAKVSWSLKTGQMAWLWL